MLRAGSFAKLILIAALSQAASAGSFDFMPAGTPEARALRDQLNAGNYRDGLKAWGAVHGASSFGTSLDGTATLSYLLYQNGMPVVGLTNVIAATTPSRLNPALVKLWKLEMGKSKWIQKSWVQTTGGWKSVYNNDPVSLKIAGKKDVKAAFAKAERLPKEDINHKARVWWQIATRAPLVGDMDSAIHALKLMRESGQSVIGQDLISSATARVLYQGGDLKNALDVYHEIPKSSPLWVESVEERAWAYLRNDDFDHALGETVTLLSPALAPLVGPESFYLTNLLALKACDYPRIFKNSETFKQRHKARLAAIQKLAATGRHESLGEIMERFDREGVSVESAGSKAELIPRAAYRDSKFLKNMALRRALIGESKKLSDFGMSAGDLGAQASRYKTIALERLKVLATAEMGEYRQILNKMHIIEGEVIQRLAMDDNLKGQRSKLAKVEDDGEKLIFPYVNDEVWFDELDNYKARVKDCPTLKGASL